MTTVPERDRPADAGMTAAMIEAGADKLIELMGPSGRLGYSYEEVATAVLKAMAAHRSTADAL